MADHTPKKHTAAPHAARVHHPQALIELIHGQHHTLEKVDQRAGQVDLVRQTAVAWAGSQAFRKYNAFSESIGLNNAATPNLRGMVKSAKWRVIFRHIDKSSHLGEYMENIGYLAAIAAGIAEAAPKFEKIAGSNDSAAFKGLQMSAIAGTIAQRALLGVVPAGAHLIYRSLEGWCMIAGLPGGKAQEAAAQGIKTLQYADKLVQTTFRTLTDTGNQSNAVWHVIDMVSFDGSK